MKGEAVLLRHLQKEDGYYGHLGHYGTMLANPGHSCFDTNSHAVQDPAEVKGSHPSLVEVEVLNEER